MAEIKVQKIPKPKQEPEDLLALFCLHFPQYTFSAARKMPYKRIQQMLRVANKDYARRMIDLLQIVASPHAKSGFAKSLFQKFNDIISE